MAAEENVEIQTEYLRDLHLEFVRRLLYESEGTPEWYLTEHLRMQAMYWSLSTLFLLDSMDMAEPEAMIDFVLKCQGTYWDFFFRLVFESQSLLHVLDISNYCKK